MSRTPSRLVIVWLLLLGLTLGALTFGVAFTSPRIAAFGVIAAAMVKVRFVIMDFMEVGGAPWPLRLTLETWVIALAVVLLALLG